MYNVNYAPPLLQFIVANQMFNHDPFVLVDVGCALGLDPAWRLFGEQLHAYAFDPQVEECARLSAVETNPNVRYFANFIGLPDDHPYMMAAREDITNESRYYYPFDRSSAVAGLAQKTASLVNNNEESRTATETWFTRELTVDKLSLS